MHSIRCKLGVIARGSLWLACGAIMGAIVLNSLQQPEGMSPLAMGLLALGIFWALVATIVGMIYDTEPSPQSRFLISGFVPTMPVLFLDEEIQTGPKTSEAKKGEGVCGER